MARFRIGRILGSSFVPAEWSGLVLASVQRDAHLAPTSQQLDSHRLPRVVRVTQPTRCDRRTIDTEYDITIANR